MPLTARCVNHIQPATRHNVEKTGQLPLKCVYMVAVAETRFDSSQFATPQLDKLTQILR
jgi:hypothetical protein